MVSHLVFLLVQLVEEVALALLSVHQVPWPYFLPSGLHLSFNCLRVNFQSSVMVLECVVINAVPETAGWPQVFAAIDLLVARTDWVAETGNSGIDC